jgi:modification methylase
MTPLLPAVAATAHVALDSVVCCDALALLSRLETASVDIVVTSPPYNLKRKNRTATGFMAGRRDNLFIIGGSYSDYDDDMPEIEYQAWLRSVVSECLRVSRGLVWINHKTRFVNGAGIHPLSFLNFPLWSEVVWNRRGSIVMNARKFAPSHEYVFGFGRPHYWNDSFNALMTVWNISYGSANSSDLHPCPYPPALIRPLIEASCPPGGIVLDPFLGMGTTAVEAHRLGRHYIGCDISAEYCAIARARLAAPYTLPMFTEIEAAI